MILSLYLIQSIVIYSSILATILLSIAILLTRKYATRQPNIIRYESEKYFLDRNSGTKKSFPVANFYRESEIDKVYLSVVVPAYNE